MYISVKEEDVVGTSFSRNFEGFRLGCGDCTSNKIPCIACTENACNRWKLLRFETQFCWEGDIILGCPEDTYECYYAVINENIGLFWSGFKIRVSGLLSGQLRI